jgi:hypothetical protein
MTKQLYVINWMQSIYKKGNKHRNFNAYIWNQSQTRFYDYYVKGSGESALLRIYEWNKFDLVYTRLFK